MAPTPIPRPSQWWRVREGENRRPHIGVHTALDQLQRTATRRRNKALANAKRIYADLTAFGIQETQADTSDQDWFSFNRLHSGARSIASKVSSSRVIPFAATEGGTTAERRKADEFNRAIVGLFEEQLVFDNDFAWSMDALTFDAAVAKVTKLHGAVDISRVFSFDLYVDNLEARGGWKSVRTLYHRHLVDREVVLQMFQDIDEETRGKILAASIDGNDRKLYGSGTENDLILLTEGWHLPSGPDAHDGRYFVGIRNATIVNEEYECDDFPFAFMYQLPAVGHVWQVPYVERNARAQETLDRLCDSMADSVDVASKFRVLKHSQTEITPIDDENAKIYEWTGNVPPTEWTMQPFAPASFQYMEWLAAGMLQVEGVSEMSASGNVPAGLRGASGKALVVADDTFSEQMAPFMHSREAFYCRIGELALRCARELAEDNGGYVISVVDGRYLKRIKFEEIDLGEGNYRLKVQPASYLSKSPAAKYQQLSEMRANGDIGALEFRRLMGVPDLVAVNELDTAGLEVIDRTIEEILATGRPMIAFPFDDLGLIIQRGTKAIHQARLRDESPSKIGALIEYVRSAFDEQKRQAAPPPLSSGMAGPPAPGGPPAPAGPPGPPMPPGPPPGPPIPMNGAPPMAA